MIQNIHWVTQEHCQNGAVTDMGALGAHGGLSDAQDGRGLDLKKYDYYSMNDEADNFRTCRFL